MKSFAVSEIQIFMTDNHVQEFCHFQGCLTNTELIMILRHIQIIRKFKSKHFDT